MVNYAKVLNTDDRIVEVKSLPDEFDPAAFSHKFGPDKEYRLCRVVKEPKPSTTDAQIAVKVPRSIGPDTVTHAWTVRDKTPEELEGEKDSRIRQQAQARLDADKDKMRQAVRLLRSGADPTAKQLRGILAFLLESVDAYDTDED